MKTPDSKRASKSLDFYLEEIGEHELLNIEEEIDLAIKVKKGDKKAFKRLVKANLRFVVSIAKQYQNRGMSIGDLINEGNLGLMKAAERFDETRGFKFISYAVWWIRQAILQALAEHSRSVRIPINRASILNKISKAYATLEQKNERKPSAQEISNELDIKVQEVVEIFKITGYHLLSIDQSLKNDEDNTLLDVLRNKDASTDHLLIEESLKIEVSDALKILSEREAKILCLYFGLNQERAMTLEEIGSQFQITRERVRQIKEKALRQLKQNKKYSSNLKSYLG